MNLKRQTKNENRWENGATAMATTKSERTVTSTNGIHTRVLKSYFEHSVVYYTCMLHTWSNSVFDVVNVWQKHFLLKPTKW